MISSCVSSRGSAQPAGTDAITVTPTSPVRSTQKTSAASSMTAATSYRGCTYGSMSCCDGQRRPLCFSTYLPINSTHTPMTSQPIAPSTSTNFTERLTLPSSLIHLLVKQFQKSSGKASSTASSTFSQDCFSRLHFDPGRRVQTGIPLCGLSLVLALSQIYEHTHYSISH